VLALLASELMSLLRTNFCLITYSTTGALDADTQGDRLPNDIEHILNTNRYT
jgi:hypothetical protein